MRAAGARRAAPTYLVWAAVLWAALPAHAADLAAPGTGAPASVPAQNARAAPGPKGSVASAHGAGEVDYTRDTPPEARSWQRRSPLDEASDGTPGAAAAEAAVAQQEVQLLRPLLRMIAVLGAIVLLMLLLARGARLMQQRLPGWVGGRPSATSGPRLQIVDRLSLGPKHTLAWVERDDGGAFLVAWGEGGTSLLGPLARESRPSFAATMAEVSHAPVPTSPSSATPAPSDAPHA